MIETSHLLRKAYLDLLNPFIIEGVTIPIFDNLVNPAITNIFKYKGADCYIIVLDQNEVETSNNDCSQRTTSVISLDIVTKYPLNVGGVLASELISSKIQTLVNTLEGQSININLANIQVLGTSLINSRSFSDQGLNLTIYRKRLTFQHSIYQF
jgi:hypothetical protein